MDQEIVKIICLGDVVGRPGRTAVQQLTMRLRQELAVDCVIANCENAAGGSGVTFDTADALFMAGVDILTSGNHVWRKKEAVELLARDPRIIRPANYPAGAAGSGSTIIETAAGVSVAVLNLMGRVFMDAIDCPFLTAEKELARLKAATPVVVVDMHAEATSEKVALGWFLDGKASVVFGTHTHIQTADERILPRGTAYITDVGMTGPYDSVIGREVDPILRRFLTGIPGHSDVAAGNIQLRALYVEVDAKTGKAVSLKRIAETLSCEAMR